MSTTTKLSVAVSYAQSLAPVLLRVRTRSFMSRGADLSWCSAFPAEAEVVYPPLTYLQFDALHTIEVGSDATLGSDATFSIIDAVPHIAT